MTGTPPNRRGITFKVGAPLEARDNLKNWYAASIEKIDYEEERVLIHYRQWSHRYDEWFDWGSPYLRPVERIQLRREGLREHASASGFHVNEKVLASWTDCRFYPAKIMSVNKDASYTVKFCDGIIQTVKEIHVKPFCKDRKGGKTKREERNRLPPRPRQSADREMCENHESPRDNGAVRSKGPGRGPGHATEEEEERAEESDDEHRKGSLATQPPATTEAGDAHDMGRTKEDTLQSNSTKPSGRACVGRGDRESDRRQTRGQSTEAGPVDRSEGQGTNGEKEGGRGDKAHGRSDREHEDPRSQQVELSDATARSQAAPQEVTVETLHQSRGRQARLTEGGGSQRDVLELRKRKICLGPSTPSKRTRPNTNADDTGPAEPQPTAAPEDQKPCESGSSAALPAVSVGDGEAQGMAEGCAPANEGQPAAEQAPVVRRPQQPNPNKYSREPLYRVVKNQPPPVLSINLDHNPFKCKAPGCLKSFRNAKLLHYHVKYYHQGDEAAASSLSPARSIQTRASERQAATQDRPRTRHSAAASLDFSLNSTQRTAHPSRPSRLNERRRTLVPPSVSARNRHRPLMHEKSKENHVEKTRCKQNGRDQNLTDTVTKHRDRMNERKRRDFLCIRLKKKKKRKKSESDEDSGSDWSTDSPVWSEEGLEEELDVVTPSHTRRMVTSVQSSDIIHCICGVQEENDLMIQCEGCLSWQHGPCMGLTKYNAPDRYMCFICRDLTGQRRSLHYRYDQDWLNQGHMYGLSFLEENYSHQNARKITATHQLLGDVHHVFEVLNGLQLKINILQSQSLADLKPWRQPWRKAEKPRRAAGSEKGVQPPADDDRADQERGGVWPVAQMGADRVSHPAPVQDSYISSEHCYQKPHTYYPAVEQRLVVETRDSELEDSLRSTEDLLNLEHRYGVPLEAECGKVHLSLQIDRASHVKKVESCLKQGVEKGLQVKSEASEDGGGDTSIQRQWQINLLEHIEAVQEEVTHRMDFIEKELDVLESWLDYTGDLEPPEPLARLPQLKLRIKQLLTDLGKVQQIALCCST